MDTPEKMEILHATHTIVLEIRHHLARKYDITKGEYENYTGLCDEATRLFIDRIKEYQFSFDRTNLTVSSFHGEQKHSFKILSQYWTYEHTWGYVEYFDFKLYVDITCGQFKWFNSDYPDFYISEIAPPWLYPDDDNFRWKLYRKYNGLGDLYADFQYDIYGKLSDLIHKIWIRFKKRV